MCTYFVHRKKWFYVYHNKREPLRVDVIQVRKVLVDSCATKEFTKCSNIYEKENGDFFWFRAIFWGWLGGFVCLFVCVFAL